MKILKKFYKKILIGIIAIYVISIFISQQKTLSAYQQEVDNYETQIAREEDTKESLTNMKDNVNSPEYIEEVAREKLGMYLPNERVYIDMAK
ncbi:MAG: FtsB family cell division protein [Clostridia bacterium]